MNATFWTRWDSSLICVWVTPHLRTQGSGNLWELSLILYEGLAHCVIKHMFDMCLIWLHVISNYLSKVTPRTVGSFKLRTGGDQFPLFKPSNVLLIWGVASLRKYHCSINIWSPNKSSSLHWPLPSYPSIQQWLLLPFYEPFHTHDTGK